MKFVAWALEKRAVLYFVVFFLAVGGFISFFHLGWLEDPEFTIKTAVISTSYPGASPQEVELEVTDRIEKAVQERGPANRLSLSISSRTTGLIRFPRCGTTCAKKYGR
jgi:multidrug efflux pump subunit AcrB